MRNSVSCMAKPPDLGACGQGFPWVILEFFGSVNSTMSAIRVLGQGANATVDAGFRFDIGNVIGEREGVPRAVVDLHFALLVHPRQRVLHPVLVVALGEVLARVGAAGSEEHTSELQSLRHL